MIRRILFIGIFTYASLVYLSACTDKAKATPDPAIIDIDNYVTRLEELKGYEEFEANCVTCHSLRYIEMQPDFSRKTWDAIVHKMIKSFGSPIPDSTAEKIVDYLVAVKGIDN